MVDEFGRPIKPPEKYIVIKNSLKKFVNHSDTKQGTLNIAIINEACSRVNKIVIHTYNFLRLFVISGQQIDNKFVEINRDIVYMAMKIFIKDTLQGRTVLGENKKILEFFTKFYENEYKDLWNGQKISGKNLSGIFNYIETEIITSIENNIRVHFISYLNRFVIYDG